MTQPQDDLVFADTLAAIANGDSAATSSLTMEISPGLLHLAQEQSAPNPQALVGNVLITAFRNADRFHGSKADFVQTLERVTKSLIAEQKTTVDPTTQTNLLQPQ